MKFFILVFFFISLLKAESLPVQGSGQAVIPSDSTMIQATATSAQGPDKKQDNKNEIGLKPEDNHKTLAPIEGQSLSEENKKIYIYNESEGRDPFKPYREFDPNLLKSPEDNKKLIVNLEPPKETPVVKNIKNIIVPNDIVLQGVVFNKQNPVAAIKVIEGKTYYLRQGDSIGRHDGKIVEITRDSVVVEQSKMFDGQKNVERVVLKFKKNEQN